MARWRVSILGLLWAAAGRLAAAAGAGHRRPRPHAHACPAPPQRIVSLLPSLTETVCELQACGRLVGTDRFSNWPERGADAAQARRAGRLADRTHRRAQARPRAGRGVGARDRSARSAGPAGAGARAAQPGPTRGVSSSVSRRRSASRRRAPALVARIEAPHRCRGRRACRRRCAAAACTSRSPPRPMPPARLRSWARLLARLGLVNIVPASMGPFPQLNPEFVVRAQPGHGDGHGRRGGRDAGRPGWALAGRAAARAGLRLRRRPVRHPGAPRSAPGRRRRGHRRLPGAPGTMPR